MPICNSHYHQTTPLPILQYLVIKGKDLMRIFDNLMKATPGYVSTCVILLLEKILTSFRQTICGREQFSCGWIMRELSVLLCAKAHSLKTAASLCSGSKLETEICLITSQCSVDHWVCHVVQHRDRIRFKRCRNTGKVCCWRRWEPAISIFKSQSPYSPSFHPRTVYESFGQQLFSKPLFRQRVSET